MTASWCQWCGEAVGPGVLFCDTDCYRLHARDVAEERSRGPAPPPTARRGVDGYAAMRRARDAASAASIAAAQARVARRAAP